MKKLLVLAPAMLLSACATQTFHINGGPSALESKDSQAFFLGGVGQAEDVDAAKICGGADKIAKVETEQTFVDGFLGNITLGLYTPRTARVFCKR